MADQVKIPGIGEVPKTAAYAGVAVVVVLVIVYYRSQSSSSGSGSSTAAAGSGSDPYPPDGTTGDPADPNSTDPTTGQTYGDEGIGSGAAADAYGLGGAYGSYPQDGGLYPWDGTTGNPSDPYSMDPSTGVTYGDEGGQGTGAPGGPPFGTNAEWSQYAENYLTSTVGEDAGTVSSALGAYTEGQPVTPAQKNIIDQAVAFAGNPPVTGAGGYPPSIRLQSSPASNGTVTVPKVTGQPQEAAYAILQEAGLKPSGSPVVKGKTLTVDSQSPAAGTHVQKGATVTLKSSVHGTAKIKVPNVAGMEQVNAINELKAAGLKPSYSPPPRGKTFYVDRTSPAAGASVARGATVRLYSEQKQFLPKKK